MPVLAKLLLRRIVRKANTAPTAPALPATPHSYDEDGCSYVGKGV